MAPHTTLPDPGQDPQTPAQSPSTLRAASPPEAPHPAHHREDTCEPPDEPCGDSPGRAEPAPEFGAAAVRVADAVAARIRDGSWDGDRFPTLMEMKTRLHCGLHTLCDAMRLLHQRGIVHKVGVLRADGRGADRAWRPVSVAGHDRHRFLDDVRQGRLQGVLPPAHEMAERYRVAGSTMAEQYQQLTAERLIGQVWTPDLRSRQWRVLDDRSRTWPSQPTKALALAATLAQRTPEWLQRRRDGSWYRCALPDQQELRTQYCTHAFTVDHARELLVALGVLERGPLVRPVYLPRPPLDEGRGYGVLFPRNDAFLGRDWRPAGPASRWRPLPASEHDTTIAALRDRKSWRGGRQPAADEE